MSGFGPRSGSSERPLSESLFLARYHNNGLPIEPKPGYIRGAGLIAGRVFDTLRNNYVMRRNNLPIRPAFLPTSRSLELAAGETLALAEMTAAAPRRIEEWLVDADVLQAPHTHRRVPRRLGQLCSDAVWNVLRHTDMRGGDSRKGRDGRSFSSGPETIDHEMLVRTVADLPIFNEGVPQTAAELVEQLATVTDAVLAVTTGSPDFPRQTCTATTISAEEYRAWQAQSPRSNP